MPAWLSDGMAIGGGRIAAVGYAMVINTILTKQVCTFFNIGFCLAAILQLSLIALRAIGISLAIMHIGLKESATS
ncbi:PTS sugar transporter subunit IIC [Streptobacillus moniliformis]|uniref:PTS sugar transporter subunit IIC n=1 Tax=Streptobacillus moniliformis TaxID=34105 RepID=UPI0007EEACAF|nr:PTS sugar transporter subunit IIC [Streptobacillus moniliformis]